METATSGEGADETAQYMLSEKPRAGGIARTGRRAGPPPPLNADAISGEQMVTSSFTWREAEGFSGDSKRAFPVSEAVGVGVEEQWRDNEGTERRTEGGRGEEEDEGSPWRGWTSPGAGKGSEFEHGKDLARGQGEEQEGGRGGGGGGGGGGGSRVIEKILLLLEQKNAEEEEDTCFVFTGEQRKIDRNGEEGVGMEGVGTGEGNTAGEMAERGAEEGRRSVHWGAGERSRATVAARAVKGLQVLLFRERERERERDACHI
jgi:hypothetical protein